MRLVQEREVEREWAGHNSQHSTFGAWQEHPTTIYNDYRWITFISTCCKFQITPWPLLDLLAYVISHIFLHHYITDEI